MKKLIELFEIEVKKFELIVSYNGSDDKVFLSDNCPIDNHHGCNNCNINALKANGQGNGEHYCCDQFFMWEEDKTKENAEVYLIILKQELERLKKKRDE